MLYAIIDIEKIDPTIIITENNKDVIAIDKVIDSEYAIIEGYIDLSLLSSEVELEIREEIGLPNREPKPFIKTLILGMPEEPILRIHSKTLAQNMRYRIVFNQHKGFDSQIPILFIIEKLAKVE